MKRWDVFYWPETGRIEEIREMGSAFPPPHDNYDFGPNPMNQPDNNPGTHSYICTAPDELGAYTIFCKWWGGRQ